MLRWGEAGNKEEGATCEVGVGILNGVIGEGVTEQVT